MEMKKWKDVQQIFNVYNIVLIDYDTNKEYDNNLFNFELQNKLKEYVVCSVNPKIREVGTIGRNRNGLCIESYIEIVLANLEECESVII